MLLTTQYLEEADRLAQRIAVVDRGRIAAEGTAAELKATIGGRCSPCASPTPRHADARRAALADLAAGDEPLVDAAAGEIRVAGRRPAASAEAVRRLDARRRADRRDRAAASPASTTSSSPSPAAAPTTEPTDRDKEAA